MILKTISSSYLATLICLLALMDLQAQCPPPTDLGIRKLTNISVEAYWSSASGSNFRVKIVPKGLLNSSALVGKAVSDTFYRSTLLPDTTHELYVRTECGPNNLSSWAGPYEFQAPGHPDFQYPEFHAGAKGVEVTAIGDFNNDFRGDVVAGGRYFTQLNQWDLLVYLQQPDSSLGSPLSYRVGNDSLRSLDVGDFNYDQKDDVVVGFGDSVAIFLQNSSGQLYRDTSFYSGSGVYDLKAGDLDADGLDDITVFHTNENFLKVFYQNSSFSSQSYPATAAPRGELDIADMNDDGHEDLVLITSSPAELKFYYSDNADGLLPPQTFSRGAAHQFQGLALTDMSGDGLNDAVISKITQGTQGDNDVWLQPMQNFRQVIASYIGLGHAINAADLNCDGFKEIFTVAGYSYIRPSTSPLEQGNVLHTRQTDPTRTSDIWTSGVQITAYPPPLIEHLHPKALAHGDINGDLKPDVVIADTAKGLVVFYNQSKVLGRVISDTSKTVEVKTNTDTISRSSSYSTTTTDTFHGYYLLTTFQYQLQKTFQVKTTTIDTLTLIHKAFCEHFYYDTTTTSFFAHDSTLLKTDTLTEVSEQRIPWTDGDYDYHLAIYPNPTFGELFIEIITNTDDLKTIEVQGFNGQGKHVLSETLRFEEKGTIDLSHFADAVYHFRIKWDGRTFERSVVKQ